MNLKDKVVLVTGASGGIGEAIAFEFAKKGSKLILHARNESSIKELEKRICNEKIDCISVAADFRKGKEIAEMFKKIQKKHSSLDVLVNVSGIERIYMDPLDTSEWKDVLDVNLFGAVECSREALKMMNVEGVIINISSIAGKVGIAFTGGSLPYSISKAALNTFSENLAVMVAPRIRVVAVSPGYTLTPLWDMYTEEEKEECLNDVLLKRFVTPWEIAHAVIAVAENDAITGTNIVVDAGLTLKEVK
jgi:NAD(P)-dependent dehydrogenase (short-subunit alcohol dehydrogenase family)